MRLEQTKSLENALLSELAMQVGTYGFATKVRGQSFYKEIPAAGALPARCYAFHVTFIEHETDFDVTADVAIRFHQLEELLNEYKTYLSKAERKKTFSLGVELGNFSQGEPRRWTVTSLRDIESVAPSIMDSFASIGIPYLETYSDPAVALDVFARDDKEACLHSPFHHERAMRALGMALLMGDREGFHRIATSKTAFLTSRNDGGLPMFMKVRDALTARLEKP